MLLLRLSFRLSNLSGSLRNTATQVAGRLSSSSVLSTSQIGNLRFASADAATKSTGKKSTFDSKDEVEVIEKLKQTFANEQQDGGLVPIYKKALLYGNRIAIKDEFGEYSYAQLFIAAKMLSTQISNLCGSASTQRVAFICSNTALYTMVKWACWISGQIAVPLHTQHPPKLLEYYIKNSEASLIISSAEFEKVAEPLSKSLEKPLILVDHNFIATATSTQADSYLDPKNENVLLFNDQPIIERTLNAKFYADSIAMILYTSGSTSLPKGCPISYKNIESQCKSMVEAWRITERDVLLNCLPLNHVHGSVNALACPLSVGAKVFMLSKFDSATAWSTLLNINIPSKDQISLFMGVPTQYKKLIAEYDKVFSKNERMVEFIRAQCEKKIRLMVVGSAPLTTSTFQRWYEITGHKLLSRYGMTEIGMALSNPYEMDKVRTRLPDTVGMPLPGCAVKLVNAEGKTVFETKGEYGKGFWSTEPLPVYEKTSQSNNGKNEEEISGEIYMSGPNVINEYYKRPEETKNAFANGWFKTGDIAKIENGIFKLLGRNSSDIIKTGGYKVSALEIETHLHDHPDVKDVCVVGVDDLVWGQKVVAVIVPKDETCTELPQFKDWCKEHMAAYQIPTIVKIVKQLPRNELGKINKNNIVKEFFSASE